MQPTSNAPRLALPVLIVSAAVLCQELLLVRLLAVGLWHHVTYMMVTVALLGFGLAGTVLAVAPRLAGRTPEGTRLAFAWYALLFAATTFLSGRVVAAEGIDTINLHRDKTLYLDLFQRYLVVGVPIFFGGMAVVTSLKGRGRGIARVYFANLLGSAVGCALFVLLLQPLSGPGLLGLTALAAALAAVVAAWGHARRTAVAAVLVAAASGVAAFAPGVARQAGVLRPIPPVPSKMMAEALREGGEVETTLWNPLCRIDVVGRPGVESPKDVFQDGDAPTWLFAEGDAQATDAHEIYIPYLIRPDARSLLVIGVGGGRELALAISRGIDRIVGVEINAATVSLLEDSYLDYTGRIAEHESLELVNAEGRAWLTRSDEKFDFIQMTGVDTYAALNSGAYVLSESYLYTKEAMRAYLDHLTPGGYVSILRFYFKAMPRETLRLFVTALDVLAERGVEEPGRNALVVHAGQWAALVVGNEPVPRDRRDAVLAQVSALDRRHAENGGAEVAVMHDPYAGLDTPFSRYARAVREGTRDEFLARYPYKVTPATDDSPFFYNYHRWGRFFSGLFGGSDDDTLDRTENAWRVNTGDIPMGIEILLILLGLSTAVGTVLVLGPLLVFRRSALRLPGKARTSLYFTCLGTGFMFVEIGLAQRFALFLGHPTYSLAVVLAGMLAFSGLGSLTSGFLSARRAMAVALPLVVALIAALAAVLPLLTETWLREDLPARIAIAAGVLAPVAFLMGMPMPSGLRTLEKGSTRFVPWAWGINGVASVAGSVLAIIVAMLASFTTVLVAAAALYLLAWLSRPRRR